MVLSILTNIRRVSMTAGSQWVFTLTDLISRLLDAGEIHSAALHLLPCGNVSDPSLTSLLRHLPCPRGCTMSSRCAPCHEELISRLYTAPVGTLLVWAGSEECLRVPEDRVPKYWAGATVLVLPLEEMACSKVLSLPLFRKTPFPLCAEHVEGSWTVWRRVTFTKGDVVSNIVKIASFTSGNFTVMVPGLAQTEDLRGVTLRVRFLNNYPYVYCKKFAAGDICRSPLSRPETSIVSALGAYLNFSVELRQHPRRIWGSQDANGTWLGLIASAVRDETDMAIGGISVTAVRASAVEFLREFTIIRSIFVSRKPPPLAAYLTIVAPLSPALWALVACTVLLVGLVGAVPRKERKSCLVTSLLDAYRILLGQGLSRNFPALVDRILSGIWMLTAFTIACSYTSGLTSFLINGAPDQPVETLDQLAASSYHLAVSPNNKVFVEWLEDRQGTTFNTLRKKLTFERHLASSLSSPTTGRNRAHIFEDAFFEYVLSWMVLKRNGSLWSEDLVLSRDSFMPTSLAMAVQRNTPYRRHMDYVVLRLTASGLVQKWLADALHGKRQEAMKANVEACRTSAANCRGEERKQKISFQHAEGPLLVLLLGYIVAAAVFVIELQIGRWKKRRWRRETFGPS